MGGPGSGPRPLPPRQRRQHVVRVFLNPGELAHLNELARIAGVSPAAFLRELLRETR